MNSPRTFPLAKPLLRYQADWRSLFFLIVLTFCFAIEWTGFCRGWPLRVFTCFLAIVACNVKHNQMHCRMFHSALLNTLLNYWLGFCTGTTPRIF
jgi:fatty acid desaturase